MFYTLILMTKNVDLSQRNFDKMPQRIAKLNIYFGLFYLVACLVANPNQFPRLYTVMANSSFISCCSCFKCPSTLLFKILHFVNFFSLIYYYFNYNQLIDRINLLLINRFIESCHKIYFSN